MTTAHQKINNFRVNVLERTLYSVGVLYIVGLLLRAWFAPVKPLAFSIMIVLGSLMTALGYAVGHRHISYRYAANIFLMLMTLSITLMLIYGSGFRGPVTAVLVLVPIYAAFFLGIRQGQMYGLVALSILTLSYMLDLWGFQPSNALQMHEFVDAKYIVFCTIILGSMIVVTAYEGNRDRTEKYLGLLNRELERSREQLQISLNTKSSFVANMSHEVRTPLNAILGFVSILKEDINDERKRGQLDEIERAAEILLSIINDVLDASKLESGMVELESKPYEPVAQVRNVIEMLRLQAELAEVTVGLNVKDDVPLKIMGDPVRFSQIIINLVTNAIKFSDGQDVLVELELKNGQADDPRLQVNVIDRGIGMTEEAVARLFQPFVQADASTTRKYGGTGLGLSICKGIVEQMGGNIWVESKLNEGSVFSFSLPLRQFTANQAGPEKRAPQPSAVASATISAATASSILVAEDNQTNRTIVEAFLARLGHAADYVDTGKQAVAAVQRKHYDVLLMDCHMPELDGFEATRQIIETCGSDRPRIIALTASSSEEDRLRCELAGMDGFIGKPLRLEDLRNALH